MQGRIKQLFFKVSCSCSRSLVLVLLLLLLRPHNQLLLRGSEQQLHVALGGLLQRLKLVLVLEAFALQQQLGETAAAVSGSNDGVAAALAVSSVLAKQQHVKEQQVLAAAVVLTDLVVAQTDRNNSSCVHILSLPSFPCSGAGP